MAHVTVEVSGGVVQEVLGPGLDPIAYDVLDWDNLIGDIWTVGDSEKEWNKLGPSLQEFVKTERTYEHNKLMERIRDDRIAAERPIRP